MDGLGHRFRSLIPELADRDTRLLFAGRAVRLFAHGCLSVVLVLYLAGIGLDERRIGLLLTLCLLGDTGISLGITTRADRAGRRAMLIAGALLMILAGLVFATSTSFWLLLFAATVGVLSPSGNEVGPFLPLEQAALAQTITPGRRTSVLAWYNLMGSFATASGALFGGVLARMLETRAGVETLDSYRALVGVYAVLGCASLYLFTRLSPGIEAPKPTGASAPSAWLGLHRSRGAVLRLSALFAVDAFAGGFVLQSVLAYWFHVRFGAGTELLGAIFFGANVLAGLSSLAAASVARRVGLLNTMVFTHLPSNVLLLMVPFAPSLPLAVALLLARFSISQMDVPTRQAYTLAMVAPDERSAAAGVTGIARTLGASIAPLLAAPLAANPALSSWPFLIAGGLKIVYDVAIWLSFRGVRLPEES